MAFQKNSPKSLFLIKLVSSQKGITHKSTEFLYFLQVILFLQERLDSYKVQIIKSYK